MGPQMEYLSSAISARLYVNSKQEIDSPSVKLTFVKKSLDQLPQSATASAGSFQLGSITDLLGDANKNISLSDKALMQKVS